MTEVGVYVGCAEGSAINTFDLDLETGRLRLQETIDTGSKVQWLAADQRAGTLYAALGSDPASAAVYYMAARPARLTPAGRSTLAAPMAYLSIDGSGEYLMAASYTDDLVTVGGVPPLSAAGGTGSDTSGMSTSGTSGTADTGGALTCRQSPGRHAHCALTSPDNAFVYATALGADRIVWWPFDAATGELGAAGTVTTSPGSGPRHLQFSSSGDRLYVLLEMAGTIGVYARDTATGALTELQTVSAIPNELGLVPGRVRDGSGPEPEPNAIWCAELRLTPDDRFLYCTERSSSTVSRFSVDPTEGTLRYIDNMETEAQPRGMNIDPSGRYLLICGELSNQLTVYRIDQSDGGLVSLGRYSCGKAPRCIEFTGDSGRG